MRSSGLLYLFAVVMVGALLYVAVDGCQASSPSSPMPREGPSYQPPVRDSLCEGDDFLHYDDCRQW